MLMVLMVTSTVLITALVLITTTTWPPRAGRPPEFFQP
jgi:hypothetical protein